MATRALAAQAVLCEDARARASARLDGELDDLGARALDLHLAGCAACAGAVAEMRALTALLRGAPLEPVPRSLARCRVAAVDACDRARSVARRQRLLAASGLGRAATPTSLLLRVY